MGVKIAYFSITGNVLKFIGRLGLPKSDLIDINTASGDLESPYIVIAPTYDDYMTEEIYEFIDDNKSMFKGVIGSGNKNFGEEGYIFTAKDISKKYGVPLLYDFEYSGDDEDAKRVKEIIGGIKE